MMKKLFLGLAMTIGLVIVSNAQTTYTQTNTITISAAKSPVAGCPGDYRGSLKMTNGAASFWLTPPVGTTQATFTDVSGYGTPYRSAVAVQRRADGMIWCSTNGTVTFPATNTATYQLVLYVKTPTPTNATSQAVIAQVVWQ